MVQSTPLFPIDKITINRSDRQRRELENIEELAESISKNGLINPITITEQGVLIAGERRLTAMKSLGYIEVPVHFKENLSQLQLHLLELEENVQRVDLAWPDRVAAIAETHRLLSELNEEWSQEKTAEHLNLAPGHLSKCLLVQKFVEEGHKDVTEAQQLSKAINVSQRIHDRRRAKIMDDLKSVDKAVQPADLPSTKTPPASAGPNDVGDAAESAPEPEPLNAEIICENFIKFSEQVRAKPFNFIHCDFPYGRNTGNMKNKLGGGTTRGTYDDSFEIYETLLITLVKNQEKFISPSAHMMFWFSLDYYDMTKKLLQDAGWRVDPFPLIWAKSDNTGIINDPNRGPRRIYETAFMCTLGDRKIVQPIANLSWQPAPKKIHTSEKSLPMLEHFFRMFIDDTSVMLDPTCGSGNSVIAAQKAGAEYSLGLELNEEFAKIAQKNLKGELT